jgi:hypothetical protein
MSKDRVHMAPRIRTTGPPMTPQEALELHEMVALCCAAAPHNYLDLSYVVTASFTLIGFVHSG